MLCFAFDGGLIEENSKASIEIWILPTSGASLASLSGSNQSLEGPVQPPAS
jgi:hypothetical protein